MPQKILETVDADVLGVHLEHFVATDGEHKSTVGMMLTDCVVDNLLQGAPAAMSGRINKGDVVLEASPKPLLHVAHALQDSRWCRLTTQ